MNYPYTDDYMQYDYLTHRYILTKKYVLEQLGLDLDKEAKGKNQAQLILKRVSNLIYSFIHKHNSNTQMQDYIIAKTQSGRDIIMRAMSDQLIYIRMVGDLTTSTDRSKRDLAIDDTAKETLYEIVPELGTTICYTGRLCFKTNDITEW